MRNRKIGLINLMVILVIFLPFFVHIIHPTIKKNIDIDKHDHYPLENQFK